MRYLFFLVLLFIIPAYGWAQQAQPSTIELPTSIVNALGQYLAQRPWSEVNALISSLDACIRVQLPSQSGDVGSRADCTTVTAAISERLKAVAEAVARQKAEDAATKRCN